MVKRTSIPAEFLAFVLQHKAYWMIPIIIVLLLFALILILGGTGAAPFIYTIF